MILVTGVLGFIGKALVKRYLDLGHFITNVDVVNYAADRFASQEFKAHSNYRHIRGDIGSSDRTLSSSSTRQDAAP